MDLKKLGTAPIKKLPTLEEMKISDLWQNQPVVIIFFRRFGCLFCRQSATELSTLKPALVEIGANLIGIGFDPNWEEFISNGYFEGEVYLDANKETYKQLEFKRLSYTGFVKFLFTKKSKKKYQKSKENGIEGNLMEGDGFQNGGALVVDKGGENILLSFKQENPADWPANKEILKVLGGQVSEDVSENENDSD